MNVREWEIVNKYQIRATSSTSLHINTSLEAIMMINYLIILSVIILMTTGIFRNDLNDLFNMLCKHGCPVIILDHMLYLYMCVCVTDCFVFVILVHCCMGLSRVQMNVNCISWPLMHIASKDFSLWNNDGCDY